ncbi:MAG: CCA tRNA nucleotidyltransferase [Chloroflexi bacterium]|nr:CCA tRNA nucleotidyltransferase [Chloroflexota bacterium]
MAETTNLVGKIVTGLPEALVSFLRQAGEVAASQGQHVYLVGGAVRDLLLGETHLDIDLVVEGDAVALARELKPDADAWLTIHSRFGTAKLKAGEWSIDFATARSETYARPGALPKVQPGTIQDDLFRRDFTINAMAVSLDPSRFGELIDPHGGMDDLARKHIRTLHEKSFIDDATRIWRAIRYEQRLDFRIESVTLRLLQRDIPMLVTISSDRVRHELEFVLKEKYPEKGLKRAGELGVLQAVHPSLKGDGWLAARFARARQIGLTGDSLARIYLALLAYPLAVAEAEQLIAYLRLPGTLARILRDLADLREKRKELEHPELANSEVFFLLYSHVLPALLAFKLATGSKMVRQYIDLYLDKLRYIRPALNGDDLRAMGIAPGPRLKDLLHRLHVARLDGVVTSRQDEVEMVRRLVPLQT